MPELVGYGPADSRALRLLSSERAAPVQVAKDQPKEIKTSRNEGVEVVLKGSRASGSNLTYENLRPRS